MYFHCDNHLPIAFIVSKIISNHMHFIIVIIYCAPSTLYNGYGHHVAT